jgi:HlyD family secretion protein
VEEQRVNVIIELTSPREQWRALGDGFRVGVRLVVLQAPKVLRVPTSAVFPRAGGEGHAVFVIDGSRARLQAVTLKARNDTQAWVEQGLAEGAQVIVYPPPAVRDGVRVQERTTRSSP